MFYSLLLLRFEMFLTIRVRTSFEKVTYIVKSAQNLQIVNINLLTPLILFFSLISL